MKAGADNYRAFVGPPDQYDFMGATQFCLLYLLGLREEHRVIDIGCGSLRAGKLLIQFLLPGRYIGIEPNDWLWRTALREEIGEDVVELKQPIFSKLADFTLSDIAADSADFTVAQSIYSHTGIDVFRSSLSAAARVTKGDGQFLFTALSEGSASFEALRPGADQTGWHYPQCVTFKEIQIEQACGDAGLFVQKLPWFHPRQIWYRAVRAERLLLTDAMRHALGHGKPMFDSRFA